MRDNPTEYMKKMTKAANRIKIVRTGALLKESILNHLEKDDKDNTIYSKLLDERGTTYLHLALHVGNRWLIAELFKCDLLRLQTMANAMTTGDNPESPAMLAQKMLEWAVASQSPAVVWELVVTFRLIPILIASATEQSKNAFANLCRSGSIDRDVLDAYFELQEVEAVCDAHDPDGEFVWPN